MSTTEWVIVGVMVLALIAMPFIVRAVLRAPMERIIERRDMRQRPGLIVGNAPAHRQAKARAEREAARRRDDGTSPSA